MCLCFYDFSIRFWNWSDTGILLFFIYQDDATLISQGYVGDPDNGFELQVWKYIIPVTNVTVVRAVTALDCWPVNQLEYGIFGNTRSEKVSKILCYVKEDQIRGFSNKPTCKLYDGRSIFKYNVIIMENIVYWILHWVKVTSTSSKNAILQLINRPAVEGSDSSYHRNICVDVNPFPTTVMKQPEYCH
jgi:hypothetical protein